MSEWRISQKRLRIDHLIHMDEPLCIDTLMDSACDCIELCRDRGLNVESEIKMVNKAFDERNSARLEQLIARVQARLQKFDAASVGASSASPVQNSPAITIQSEWAVTSSSVAESQNRIPIPYASSSVTSSSVAESQTRIRIPNADQASLAPFPAGPEYHVAPRTKRGPKPKILIRVTTDGVSSPPGEAPAPRRYKTSCKYDAFRQFAFDLGKKHLERKTLGQITIKSIIAAYEEAHQKLPRTMNASLQWDTLHRAVAANDINLLHLRRIRDPTRDAKTMQEKLSLSTHATNALSTGTATCTMKKR
jgi:hypothetical protein